MMMYIVTLAVTAEETPERGGEVRLGRCQTPRVYGRDCLSRGESRRREAWTCCTGLYLSLGTTRPRVVDMRGLFNGATRASGVDMLLLFPVDDVTKWSGCSTRAAAEVVVVLFVGALTGVWVGWGLVGVAQCCHRQLWQCEGAYEAAIRFSKPAPTRFPSFPASSMASSCSICCRCSGVSRRCGVAVLAFFSVILCFWRWLFTLLGGG